MKGKSDAKFVQVCFSGRDTVADTVSIFPCHLTVPHTHTSPKKEAATMKRKHKLNLIFMAKRDGIFWPSRP